MEQVNRLEQALRVWEDTCFVRRVRAQALRIQGKQASYPLAGPILHAHEFRSHLLSSGGSDFDGEKFIASPDTVQALTKAIGPNLISLPLEISSWTAQSRRIFRPSAELQAVLNATALDGVRWPDVPWPFGAFALALEVPLKDEKGIEYDGVLMHSVAMTDEHDKEWRVIQFRMLSTAFEKAPLDRFSRDAIAKALKLQQWHKLDRRLKDADARLRGAKTSVFSLVEDQVGDALVTESVRELLFRLHQKTCQCGGTHPEWDQAVRLSVGLCLYLSTLPAKTPHRGDWAKPKKVPGGHPMAIVNEAEVCSVTSIHSLTAEEKELFITDGQHVGGRELSAHWRRGHWRRPPGKGNDPTASKVVHVRPTLVRRDKLAPGSLTVGSETKMG